MTLEEAHGDLSGLIDRLGRGEESFIVRGSERVARIVDERTARPRREPGNCVGTLVIHNDDLLEDLPTQVS